MTGMNSGYSHRQEGSMQYELMMKSVDIEKNGTNLSVEFICQRYSTQNKVAYVE